MRSVSNVSASIDVLANAILTMIALVENKTAPVNVMRKPANESLLSAVFSKAMN